MAPFTTSVAALALAFAGLTTLALAMARHYGAIWRRSPTAAEAALLRALGALLLLEALLACTLGWGVVVGLVAWFCLLSVAGLGLVLLLPYAPQRVLLLAQAGAPLALLLLLAGGR